MGDDARAVSTYPHFTIPLLNGDKHQNQASSEDIFSRSAIRMITPRNVEELHHPRQPKGNDMVHPFSKREADPERSSASSPMH